MVHSTMSNLALGYGSIDNHSYEPNAHLVVDINSKTNAGVIYATKLIEDGEILINYGKNYWAFWGEIDKVLDKGTDASPHK